MPWFRGGMVGPLPSLPDWAAGNEPLPASALTCEPPSHERTQEVETDVGGRGSASPDVESENIWKWEIWPHPYDGDFDSMVTDNDEEARVAIMHVAEMHLWDGNDGGERTMTVMRTAKT